MTVNSRIKQFIQDNHLKQSSIAHDMGINTETLSAIVRGQRKIDPDELVSFCRVVKTDPSYLLSYGGQTESYCIRLESKLLKIQLLKGDQLKPETRITLMDIIKNDVDETNIDQFREAFIEVAEMANKEFNRIHRKRRKQKLLDYKTGLIR